MIRRSRSEEPTLVMAMKRPCSISTPYLGLSYKRVENRAELAHLSVRSDQIINQVITRHSFLIYVNIIINPRPTGGGMRAMYNVHDDPSSSVHSSLAWPDLALPRP